MRANLKTIAIALTALGVTAGPLLATHAEAATRHRVYVCEKSKARTRNGTLIGAGGGALLGSAIAGHGAKTEGAVLGGVLGGVAGHQVGKKKKCHYVYRYY